MSLTSSRALAASHSASPVPAPSAPSHSASASLSLVTSSPPAGLASPSIPTSAPLLPSSSLQTELFDLMSLSVASPAKTSALQEKAQASTASGPDSGVKWRASSGKSDLVGQLLRTALRSEVEARIGFSVTWRRSVTPHGRPWWVLSMPVLGTDGSASGLLRTPTLTVADSRSSGSRNTATSKAHPGVSLTDWVRGDGGIGRRPLSPTLTTGKGGDTGRSDDRIGEIPSLQGMASRGVLQSLPTLCASDHKATGYTMRGKFNPGLRIAASPQDPGPLNPTWCEWYMGFPVGWTDLPGWKRPKASNGTRSRKSLPSPAPLAASPTEPSASPVSATPSSRKRSS